MHYYLELKGDALYQTVPLPHRRAAEQAVAEAAKDLGIPTPRIVWCRESTALGTHELEVRTSGWVYPDRPDTIYLNATLQAEDIRGACFHECRHAWQHITMRYCYGREGEQDAQSYAYKMTGQLAPVASWDYRF